MLAIYHHINKTRLPIVGPHLGSMTGKVLLAMTTIDGILPTWQATSTIAYSIEFHLKCF